MDNFKFRDQLQPGDLGAIVYMHGKYAAFENGYDHTFEAYVAEPLSKCILSQSHREKVWIVESEGNVVGSIAICEISQCKAQLRWFILIPEARGKGIGKKLMSCAIRFAQRSGYKKIELTTESNLCSARKIYENYGFKLASTKEMCLWGKTLKEQIYILELHT